MKASKQGIRNLGSSLQGVLPAKAVAALASSALGECWLCVQVWLSLCCPSGLSLGCCNEVLGLLGKEPVGLDPELQASDKLLGRWQERMMRTRRCRAPLLPPAYGTENFF